MSNTKNQIDHFISCNQINTFTSTSRGFQAQQSRGQLKTNSDTAIPQQHRPPPPGERRMTAAERDLYKDAICQFCDKHGHITKICWWLPKKTSQNHELPQALAALTLDNSIVDT